jgi:23S rRNA (cytosine1962-C5)-methyltransferase
VFEANMPGFVVEDISQKTIPEDFRNRSVHRCWRIRRG